MISISTHCVNLVQLVLELIQFYQIIHNKSKVFRINIILVFCLSLNALVNFLTNKIILIR